MTYTTEILFQLRGEVLTLDQRLKRAGKVETDGRRWNAVSK